MEKPTNPNWTVLLIGGSSGVGKSHLARQLAEHYKTPFTEVDDIRIALHQLVDKEQYPDLFTFIDNPNFYEEYDEHDFTEKLLSIARVLWKSLDVLISKHVALEETVIFEGDGVIPELLSKRDLDKVKSVFIYDDIEHIKERQMKRNRQGKALEKMEKNALFSYAYSEELRRQAEEHGFLTIKASPLETLYERAVEIIDSSN